MIKLSNGMEFESKAEIEHYIGGIKDIKRSLSTYETRSINRACEIGRNHALSTAIAAIDVAIENAELALKSAQQKGTKMKAVKKQPKPVAKKPVTKPAAKKPAAKKK